MTEPTKISHIGRGLYDLAEASYLLAKHPDTLASWILKIRGSSRTGTRTLSFLDLISLQVVSELRRRGLAWERIETGITWLSETLSTEHPLAHKGLATAGREFFAEVEGWLDAGQGGQLAFDEVIIPTLKPIDFDELGLARRWRPSDHVLLDPEIQAGAPCVTGTRVPTAVVFDLFGTGLTEADIADEFDLTEAQVFGAIRFENALAAA